MAVQVASNVHTVPDSNSWSGGHRVSWWAHVKLCVGSEMTEEWCISWKNLKWLNFTKWLGWAVFCFTLLPNAWNVNRKMRTDTEIWIWSWSFHAQHSGNWIISITRYKGLTWVPMGADRQMNFGTSGHTVLSSDFLTVHTSLIFEISLLQPLIYMQIKFNFNKYKNRKGLFISQI